MHSMAKATKSPFAAADPWALPKLEYAAKRVGIHTTARYEIDSQIGEGTYG